ncbi:MAG: CotH kinase family protein [Deltaproteobacteria bacterium]|nr:CotH kinase family protein [Deltaproteobacteria bacterium]
MTKKLIKNLWKWSWVFTLPVVAAFLIWAFDSWRFYSNFSLRYGGTTTVGLFDSGMISASYLSNGLKSFISPDLHNKEERLEAMHLYVKESEVKRLNSRLPSSGREYVEASLLYPDGKVQSVEVRYRGDFPYHWSGKKKSIRVKTRKGRLYNGMRQFNLIVPKTRDVFSNYLSYALASRMGLMTPEAKFVDLYQNGRYSGVYLFVEQLGEQFLRRNFRMPGDLYVGELVGRDLVPVVGREVFQTPGFWTKAAVNNHNPPESNEPLKELTKAVYSEDPERLLSLIDMDAWARFAAFITVCRTTHFDITHNWRLYFDPAKGRFEPVVWDPLGWSYDAFVPNIEKQSNTMDVISSFVFERLHSDHRFMAAKHAAVEEFFSSGGAEYLKRLMDATGPLKASIRRDRNIVVNMSRFYSPPMVLKEMDDFRRLTVESLEEVKAAYSAPPSASWDIEKGRIWLTVDGFTPVRFLEVEFASPQRSVSKATIGFTKDGEARSKDISRHVTVNGNVVSIEAPLFARRAMTFPWAPDSSGIVKDAVIEPASYAFSIAGTKGPVVSVRAGYAGGQVAELEKASEMERFPLDGNYSVVPVEGPAKAYAWSGEVVVNGVTRIDGDLNIAPGTRVSFTPNSSLIVRGRLFADGEEGRPVVFGPQRKGQEPWGAVVLAGRGANGSTLKHCVFSGGSGLKDRFVEYSAMLSIHDVKSVVVEDCVFSDNKVVDDMVHAVYSGMTIRRSLFSGANRDGLDLDYTDATIMGSRFSGSGNDGLDLMSSQVAVLGSEMIGSGDKGVSVGEGAKVFVWNTRITGNEIGVQAKDSSSAFIYNTELSGNKKTIDAYKKNWQYGDGGHVFVSKSSMRGAGAALTADKDSSLKVFDSFLEGETGGKRKNIFLDETVDTESAFERRARTKDAFISSFELPAFVEPYLEMMDPTVRGRTIEN